MRRSDLSLLCIRHDFKSYTNIAPTDEVESKNADMATAIAEEDKKVQAQSDAMVSAIEKNSKRVDDPNLEKDFEKASSHVDAVTNSADEKMVSKGLLLCCPSPE